MKEPKEWRNQKKKKKKDAEEIEASPVCFRTGKGDAGDTMCVRSRILVLVRVQPGQMRIDRPP